MKSSTKTILQILGLLFFYWGVTSAVSLAVLIMQYMSYRSQPEGSVFIVASLGGSLIAFIVTVIFSFWLVFRTEKFMKIFKIEAENINLETTNSLAIGCKLIGIYLFVTKIGGLARIITLSLTTIITAETAHLPEYMQQFVARDISSGEFFAQFLPIVFALLLIFGTKSIVKLINN
jgi:hypothetical protein